MLLEIDMTYGELLHHFRTCENMKLHYFPPLTNSLFDTKTGDIATTTNRSESINYPLMVELAGVDLASAG